jgi:hypothetical protein
VEIPPLFYGTGNAAENWTTGSNTAQGKKKVPAAAGTFLKNSSII